MTDKILAIYDEMKIISQQIDDNNTESEHQRNVLKTTYRCRAQTKGMNKELNPKIRDIEMFIERLFDENSKLSNINTLSYRKIQALKEVAN